MKKNKELNNSPSLGSRIEAAEGVLFPLTITMEGPTINGRPIDFSKMPWLDELMKEKNDFMDCAADAWEGDCDFGAEE